MTFATVVLDSSALLASLQNEEGAALVEAAQGSGSLMTVVNWTEVLARLVDKGRPVEWLGGRLTELGVRDSLRVVGFDEAAATRSAALRSVGQKFGLSLAIARASLWLTNPRPG